MVPDYTINDAHRDGFECGLVYILRFYSEVLGESLSDEDIQQLVSHLGSKKPWKTTEEWRELIYNNLSRFG